MTTITINMPHVTKEELLVWLLALNGLLAAIVKFCPTIPSKYPWLVTIIKILGKITHNQTDDDAVRAIQNNQLTTQKKGE